MSAALQTPSGRIPLETASAMIGYTADGRLVVNDLQATSIAAIITASGQGYTITSINNAYQITINGHPLGLQQVQQLHPNDTIAIGETKLIYEESQAVPYTPIPPAPAEPPTPAETNPYSYDLDDEDKTLIRRPPDMVKEMQVSTEQQVATGPQAPVEQRPFTPPPINVGSGEQWPQYPAVASDPYSPPPAPTPAPIPTSAPLPAPLPASQPFTGPQQVLPASTGSPGMGAPRKTLALPSWLLQDGKPDPLKLLLVGLVVVLVLVAAGSGTLIYRATRPQPIVTLNSQYMQGNVPVGAVNTSLHVVGYTFTSNSPITFLLDNRPVTGVPNVQSDKSGNFQVDLPITALWPVGMHKLTAKDGSGYPAINIGKVSIVNQGEAGTPGPHGAPPDNSSFTLKLTQTSYNISSAPLTTILTVNGNNSGNGSTVCDPYSDTNQQVPTSGSLQNNGVTYQGTDTYTCQGTYKAGKLSYTDMVSEKLKLSDGSSCQTDAPATIVQLEGTFSDAHIANGTFSVPGYMDTCTGGKTGSVTFGSINGIWTGTVA